MTTRQEVVLTVIFVVVLFTEVFHLPRSLYLALGIPAYIIAAGLMELTKKNRKEG